MTSAHRFSIASLVASLVALAIVIPTASARRTAPEPTAQAQSPRGQTVTRLADGRSLILGGESPDGTVATATLLDPATNARTTIPALSRAGHTATLLPDGTVLIAGGVGPAGQPVPVAELFDPAANVFVPVGASAGMQRAGHTATVLTDGSVFVAGGTGVDGEPRTDAEIWRVEGATLSVTAVAAPVRQPGRVLAATLLPDGTVLLGHDNGASEIFDPVTQQITPAALPPQDSGPAVMAGASPSDGATDVPVGVRVALRFSQPLRPESVTAATVTLSGPDGPVDLHVVPTEQGRLLFATPRLPLAAGTTYVVSFEGGADQRGAAVAGVSLRFTTAEAAASDKRSASDDEAWMPNPSGGKDGWRANRPDAPAASLPPLTAPPGVTALAGQVLRLNGQPLADVTLEIDDHQTQTDRTGRFLLLLPGVAAGHHELKIDGSSANRGQRTYGFFEYGLTVAGGQTTVLPFTIWMPLLDTAHQVAVASPTLTETVVTTPYIPGLELHVPAGTTIRDDKGQVVRALSITAIPVDRTPFPLARNVDVPVYFTIQPGGAYVYSRGSGPRGAWLVYPNYRNERAEKKIQFFHYDPEERGWYVYGLGTVTKNQTQVIPDPTTRLYEFTGAMINSGSAPPTDGPPPGDCCGNGGDPVNLTTGLFTLEQTDVALPDVLPIAITRSYRSRDLDSRPFGIGTTHPYAMFMWSALQYQQADLVLPDGAKIHYVRTSTGTGFTNAVFEHKETATTSATPTAFYKSVMTWNGNGWDVRLKDGTVYVFGENAPLQAIRDRYGNTIVVQHANGQMGNITRVISPFGRWLEFSYDDSDRITQVKDNISRAWTYTYDAAGNLWKVSDPLLQVTEYTYNSDHNMLTVKNRNGIVYVTNEYTTSAEAPTPVGWVKKQTHADTGVYQFAYTVANGKSTSTDVTDPRGYVRRVTFNADGYTLTDTRALGQPEERNTSSTRPSRDNFITARTDEHLLQTTTSYDSAGNVTSITRLAGTGAAVTTSYTYEARFNQLSSVTDPLTQTTAYTYDDAGHLMSITDPLLHQTTFAYNNSGQRTAVTDALQHTTSFGYSGGDLITISDPLNRVTRRFVDGAGRVLTVLDPLGQVTRYSYDLNGQVRTVTDALSGQTLFDYFPDGQLKTVTDANQHTTTYTYDVMGRVASRTDPMQKTEYFTYDLSGNPNQLTSRQSQVTGRTYDPLNRLKQITYDGGSTITYTYDDRDRVTQIADSVSGVVGRGYDDLHRLTSESTPQGVISYAYDASDRRTRMTVEGQPDVTYGYDDAGRLMSVDRGAVHIARTYDDADRLASLTLPNGITVQYQRDAASQLNALTYASGGNTIGTLTYAYDDLGRRVQVGGTWARTLLPPVSPNITYDAANRLLTRSGQSFSYDANGSLASNGQTDFAFNPRGQLVGITGEQSGSFTYDALARRSSKTIAGQTTAFLHDGLNAVQDTTGTSIVARLTSLSIDEVFGSISTADSRWVLLDALGSVVAETDGTGAVQTEFSYEPYGGSRTSGALTSNPYTYTGREKDATGLFFYRARYYDPDLQRFISEDPLQFSSHSVNFYQYSGGNPIDHKDPLGLVSWDCDYSIGGISEIVGGGFFIARCVSQCVDGHRVSASLERRTV